jgi:NADH-quinone oxidoreductase subunit F
VFRPIVEKPEVVIVGSGPAGLSCAYFLALLGRSSVIFEAAPVPGGMLALGIPEFRLPKKILQKEIDFIVSHGVELRTDSRVDDVNKLIEQGFKAVFVATGAQTGKAINIDGIDFEGVVDSLAFLRDRALGKGMNCAGKRVVVLGGGNGAVDAARSAVRLGAKQVTILYRRTREEMPAYEEEIEEAINEGVELVTLSVPRCILGADGVVTGIEFLKAELGKAELDGRRRPVPIEGSESTIECDIVIPAIGQVPSTEVVSRCEGLKVTDAGTVNVDRVTFKTGNDKVFAGGDCVTGAASVIEAIAAGQKAAVHIDRMLGGMGELPEDKGFSLRKPDEAVSEPIQRVQEKNISLSERKRGFAEVVLGLDRTEAIAEAGRCLRCDLEKS